MKAIHFDRIPPSLRERDQWILWRLGERDGKETKLPAQADGSMAKSNDPATWTTFDKARAAYGAGGFTGLGFVFAEDDPFYGIDLDGCRDPETGTVADWAREIVLDFATYAEVSPSRTGVKLFCRGEPPVVGGKKRLLTSVSRLSDKTPAVEVYSRLRYFAVTGWRLRGMPADPAENPGAAARFRARYLADEPTSPQADWRSDAAVIERARRYVARMPPAVSGQSGHNATFHVACVLVCGFGLGESDALNLLREYNETCRPPWSEKELTHKVSQAAKQPGTRGYLRDAAPERWGQIPVPPYQEPAPAALVRTTTLVDAARDYLDSIRGGVSPLISTGIPDLDYALGGGVEKGEMVILGARPSHGKSAVGLQCCHYWAESGMPCLVISEEMSSRMLGRRMLQFSSALPQEYWRDRIGDLEREVSDYERRHQKILIAESCGKAEVAAREIEKHVGESGVQCVVVDYAQLLCGPGQNRYEQITKTSILLRQTATRLKVVLLVLCQLSRGVESRPGEFMPVMSDLKETGQLEQDADVILFGCWPHRINPEQSYNKYQFFVAKNRNRAINQSLVMCHFRPDRQAVTDAPPESSPAFTGIEMPPELSREIGEKP